MEMCLGQARSQYDGRIKILMQGSGIQIQPLAEHVASYCVNEFYLFEEILVFYWDKHKNYHADLTRKDSGLRSLHDEYETLQKKRNPIIRKYTEQVDTFVLSFADKYEKLQLAMALSGYSPYCEKCQRLVCYFNGCSCNRPLFYHALYDASLANSF